MLSARGIHKRFGLTVALDGVDLDLGAGECVALFGPNGAGKTTLLRVLSTALRPDRGTLTVFGRPPRPDDRDARARIGVVSHAAGLYDDLGAVENLIFFAGLYGVASPSARARSLIARFRLEEHAAVPVRFLSRGLRQRVSLARALVNDPELVFFDEPFTGLDPSASRTLEELIAELAGHGKAILLVTHDLRRGLELSNRFAVLAQARIVQHGPSDQTAAASIARSFDAGPPT